MKSIAWKKIVHPPCRESLRDLCKLYSASQIKKNFPLSQNLVFDLCSSSCDDRVIMLAMVDCLGLQQLLYYLVVFITTLLDMIIVREEQFILFGIEGRRKWIAPMWILDYLCLGGICRVLPMFSFNATCGEDTKVYCVKILNLDHCWCEQ